jgi:hypothetical protein
MLNVEKKCPLSLSHVHPWLFLFHILTGAKRREWMGPDGLLGVAGMMIDS